MATFNVNDLVTRVRRKADMANTNFVSDAEIIEYINEAYNKYYNNLVTSYENYFVTSVAIPMVVGTEDYSLPVDLFKVSVFIFNDASDNRFVLRPFNLIDSNRKKNNITSVVTNYILFGDTVKFVPQPKSASDTVTLYYVPQPTALAAGSTVSLLAGGDEYLVLDAAVSCLMKEESDYSGLEMKAQQKMADITTVLAGRNSDIPLRVSDTETMNIDTFPYIYGA